MRREGEDGVWSESWSWHVAADGRREGYALRRGCVMF